MEVEIRRRYKEPEHLRYQAEKQRIREIKIEVEITRTNKQLEESLRLRQFDKAYTLANTLADLHRQLAKSLYHSAYLHGKLNSPGQTAEPKRLDYSRYTGFVD